MDLKKLNTIAQKTCLTTKKLTDLEIHRTYVVSRVRDVQTKFGDKVILEVDEEFQFFLPNQLQLYFTKEPNQLTCMKAEVERGTLLVEYLGERKLKFMTRRDDPYYRELAPY